MGRTSIPYVNYSFSPWGGCHPVSEGCANCFARDIDRRFYGGRHWIPGQRRVQRPAYWQAPFGWNRQAERVGERRLVLCGTMCDPCDPLEVLDPHRRLLEELIADTPWLLWLLLTKRPQYYDMFHVATLRAENVLLGATLENQARADERLPVLTGWGANGYWVSCEPLLGPIKLGPSYAAELELVVVGDEDGVGRRPAELDWVRALRDECQGVTKFFFKQWHFENRKTDTPALDGRRWVEVPE